MGFYSGEFNYDYYFPKEPSRSPTNPSKPLDSSVIDVSDTADVPVTVGGKSLYNLAFTETSARFEFTQAALWTSGYVKGNKVTPVQFNGPVFSWGAGDPEILRVTLKSNIAGLDSKDLSYDAHSIKIDFTGIHASKGSYLWLSVSFNDPINGTSKSEPLHGNSLDNKISGGAGDDVLFGGGGADKLDGGAGNDTASYAGSATGVTASLLQPSINTNDAKGDRYYSIENLAGSSSSDTLIGNAGANHLSGGHGKDVLTGGAGHDTFIFDTSLTSANIDKVTDFNPKEDVIWLAEDIFSKAGAVGDLSSGAFYSGPKAHDNSDRIIYDKSTGKLWYDDDGNGGHAAVQIAELAKNLHLSDAHFDIIGA